MSVSGIAGSIRSLGSRSAGKGGVARCRPNSEGSGSLGLGRSVIGRDRWVRLGGRSGSKTSLGLEPARRRHLGFFGPELALGAVLRRPFGLDVHGPSRYPGPCRVRPPRAGSSGLRRLGGRVRGCPRRLACLRFGGGRRGPRRRPRSSLISARPSPKRRGGLGAIAAASKREVRTFAIPAAIAISAISDPLPVPIARRFQAVACGVSIAIARASSIRPGGVG